MNNTTEANGRVNSKGETISIPTYDYCTQNKTSCLPRSLVPPWGWWEAASTGSWGARPSHSPSYHCLAPPPLPLPPPPTSRPPSRTPPPPPPPLPGTLPPQLCNWPGCQISSPKTSRRRGVHPESTASGQG